MLLTRQADFRAARTFRMLKHTLLTGIYEQKYANADKVSEQAFEGIDPATLEKLWANFDPKMAVGKFTILMPDGQRKELEFDSHNPQFHALYLDRYSRGYEPEVAEFIDAVLSDDGGFYDIGSNWGYFVLFVAVRPGFRGVIHAFEPGPSFQDLRRLIRALNLQARVKCYKSALASVYGRARIESPLDRPIETGLGHVVLDIRGVQMFPLDSLEIREAPTVIKIDVEGLEDDVFAGGEALIQRHRPFLVFENVVANMNSAQAALTPLFRLEKWGYQLFVPVWLVKTELLCPVSVAGSQVPSLMADNRAVTKFGADTLALRSFTATERSFMQKKINCVAVHKDHLAELKGRCGFSETSVSV